MPFYRITGQDRHTYQKRERFVEARDKHSALNESRSVVGGVVDQVDQSEMPDDARVFRSRKPATSKDTMLLRHPILTIAVGVAVGVLVEMCVYTLFMEMLSGAF